MSKIIAIIPARSGSKGVKDKNIKKLGGYPLISWSIAACKKSELIDQIIVSTDSQIYADISTSLGAAVPFLRPTEISDDNSPDILFVEHVIDYLNNKDQKVDYIAHIRPTTPLRNPKLIDEAIRLFINSKATSLRSVQHMSESAYKYFEINDEGYLRTIGNKFFNIDDSNNPRQNFPTTYIPNGYIDVLSVKFINKNGILHGNNVIPFITPNIIEVDNEEDFKYLEFEVKNEPTLISNLFF